MLRKNLDKILENHKHWLHKDCKDWEKMRADLRGADLSSADLSYANLRGADLRDVYLRGADLSYANLSYAYLSGVDLSGAYLRDADLSSADLSYADLRYADLRYAGLRGAKLRYADLSSVCLSGADLSSADLSYADLRGADLRGADLKGAHLRNTDLSGADIKNTDLRCADLRGAKNIPFIPMNCPETGSFIAWKKASGYIVKLEILEDARRSSATTRKCRCDKSRVLEIQNVDGTNSKLTKIVSNYNEKFIYKVGEIVEEPNFCTDRWKECAEGIYFFINRQEAVEY